MTKEEIEWFDTMEPFEDENHIPRIPIVEDAEEYKNVVIANLIRCGAIPKHQLVIGKQYLGSCRNSNTATWVGTHFEYTRHKWGSSYIDTINHFEDDDGYDLFIPIKQIN